MKKSAGSKKGWKIALFSLLFLVVAFIAWAVFSPDVEEETERGRDSEASASYTNEEATNSESEKVDFLSEALREKQTSVKGDGTDTVTILVYMNGSNLESDGGEATEDISEMIAAGDCDKVNIVIETLGTKKWEKKFGIASDRAQIYEVSDNSLKLVNDNLGQLDCTETESLSEFIKWGVSNYPADRYILHFWNHGGGPVYGFGYDEWAEDEYATLTIDEIQEALKSAGVFFDFIGMDCCLMSSLEVCCACYDFCDYMILSEDFESGLGWEYTTWLKKLYENTSIPTLDLGKIICDSMVSANETEEYGDDSILAVVDESCMKLLFTAWTDFAYANEDALIDSNYSRKVSRSIGGRVHPRISKGFFSGWNYDYYDYDDYDEEEDYDMADYYVTDILSLSESVNSKESDALSAAVAKALVYVKACGEDDNMTGLSVSLPYGDSEYYDELSHVFLNSGINSDYVTWLSAFITSEGAEDFYDYGDWDSEWSGWDDDYYDYYDFDWDEWDPYYYDDSDYYYEDDYWDNGFGWDSFSYDDSWNYWFDDEHGDDYDYYYDDWYYDDYYWDY